MNTSSTEVVTVVGGYRVTLKDGVHLVNKQRRCSCGRRNCRSIHAVAAYLRAGGQRAPEASEPPAPNDLTCPICQSPARGSLEARNWTCTADRIHFFVWRTNQLRAARAEALKDASPYTLDVLSAFDSNEARAEFLAAHPLKYAAGA
jgi:hypothetical protein